MIYIARGIESYYAIQAAPCIVGVVHEIRTDNVNESLKYIRRQYGYLIDARHLRQLKQIIAMYWNYCLTDFTIHKAGARGRSMRRVY